MQLSRRSFISFVPLSAAAASIAASLKSPQAAPPQAVEFNWVESGVEYIPGQGYVSYTRPFVAGDRVTAGSLNAYHIGQLQRPEWWK